LYADGRLWIEAQAPQLHCQSYFHFSAWVASTREMVYQLTCNLQNVQMAAATTIDSLRGLPEVSREIDL